MKSKLEKILEAIAIIVVTSFALYILSFAFRFMWESVKVIFK